MKRAVRLAALALVSLALLYFLVARAGLNWPTFVHSLSGFPGWALAAIVALMGANLAFATRKWILVMRALAPESERHPRFVDAMLATTFGALLGQTMPFQIGVALARSLAGRFGVGQSASVNFGTTAYEQLFDGIVFCAVAVISLIGLALRPGPLGWDMLILLSGTAAIFVAVRLPALLALAARWLGLIPSRGRLGFIATLRTAIGRASHLPPSILAWLMALSVLRYVTNVAQIAVVLVALGMSTYTVSVMLSFPLLQIVALIPITPGNLGVIEWTWSAVLVSAGATMGAAALFAVTIRIVNIVALTVLIAALSAFHLLMNASMMPNRQERRELQGGGA